MKVYGLRKKTQDSFEVGYIQNENVQTYGEDNLYPQTLHKIIQSSPTGASCLERYATFIEGDGFNDLAFSEMAINQRGHTADDLHSQICQDLAEFGGFAIHVNYNALGQIAELNYIPFENCRLSAADDRGFVPFVVLNESWDKGHKRRGKNGAVKYQQVKECDYIYRFNPDPAIVMEQIQASGGIEFYKGQVLWYSTAGDTTYPIPRADRVATCMSTDEGLCNIQWRNVRCNFAPAGLLFTKKGQGGPFAPAGSERPSQSGAQNDFSDAITSVQGDTNTAKIVVVELESDDDKPVFEKLANANYDKEFTVTEESTTAKIYSAFQQEPWYCIKTGKVGFSGDILTDAFDYYSSIVSKEQRIIERTFDILMEHWGGPYAGIDHSVKPLRYISNAAKATTTV